MSEISIFDILDALTPSERAEYDALVKAKLAAEDTFRPVSQAYIAERLRVLGFVTECDSKITRLLIAAGKRLEAVE